MLPPLSEDQPSYHQSITPSLSNDKPLTVESVGLIGCGRMGRAMGKHLLDRGWGLTVTDVDEKARRGLEELGAKGASSAAEVAAESELVLVVVVDDDQVRTAVEGPGGVLEGARPGTIVAVCASVRPDTCRELAVSADSRELRLIDVALARGERGAEAGRLLLLCGGAQDVIDACRPVFGAFATDVVRLGEVGAGQVAKVVNNLLLWTLIRAGVEAQRLGRALGVEPSDLRPALALGSAANRPFAEWGEHRLRWPAKDLEVALDLAHEAGVDMPFLSVLPPLMEELTVDDLHDLR